MSSMAAGNAAVMKRPPNARLCHITKWDHFDGYGFNLHAEKGKPGQYIGKVDEGSPAEAAGLRQGDRILEVNGDSIADKTHKQVVEAIKGLQDETKLLVIDPLEENGNGSVDAIANANATASANANTNGNASAPHATLDGPHKGEGEGDADATKESHPSAKENGSGALNLNMTAAELRAKLKERKKFDPKKQDIDFKKKFDIVQKL